MDGVWVYDPGTFLNFNMRFSALRNAFWRRKITHRLHNWS